MPQTFVASIVHFASDLRLCLGAFEINITGKIVNTVIAYFTEQVKFGQFRVTGAPSRTAAPG